MAKRLGRTIVARSTANQFAYEARNIGADRAHKAGNCQSPVVIALTGLADKTLSTLRQFEADGGWTERDYADGYGWIGEKPRIYENERVQHVDVEVRCRKCPACLAQRAAHWRLRAQSEISLSERTWFGTLTLRPEQQFRAKAVAIRSLTGSDKWNDLSLEEQQKKITRVITGDFQRYMKRIRKNHAGLRFIAVYELHKSGLPHMHVLLHERQGPVRHAALQSQWTLGFSKWNLVPPEDRKRAAYYVCKYLTKSTTQRILASRYYGKE